MATRTKKKPETAGPAVEQMIMRLDTLLDSPFNPRRHYDEKKLDELAQAYRRTPQAIPRLLVRLQPEGTRYELVYGHRRKRGALRAGLEELEVDVMLELSDADARAIQWAENAGREDLQPLEEADGFAEWKRSGGTVEQVAELIGRPVSFVRSRLKLADLIPEARKALEEGSITIAVASFVAGLEQDQQPAMLKRALETTWDGRPPTVKQLAKALEEQTHDLARAPWSLDDETLPGGACAKCPARTGATADLFAGAGVGDRCLDKACWAEKAEAHVARGADVLRVTDKKKAKGGVLPRAAWVEIAPEPSAAQIAKAREELMRDHERDVAWAEKNGEEPEPPPSEEDVRDWAMDEIGGGEAPCAHMKPALKADGTPTTVCADPSCPVHGETIKAELKRASAPKPKPYDCAEQNRKWEERRKKEEAAAALEAKVRAQVLELVVAKLPTKGCTLQRGDLELVAWELLSAHDQDGLRKRRKAGQKELSKKSDLELLKLMWEASIVSDRDLRGWGDARSLLAQAKRLKVDVTGIRKQVLAGEKKPDGSPKKATKKKAAAKKGGAR